ncbi:MAG: hypothetical protein CMN56_09100 [Sneathiella sp.]|nr:hypothetical protein [Sneathiella sp.]
MYIRYDITKIMFFLVSIALCLIFANLAVIAMKFGFDLHFKTAFDKLILDDEENIPTFFSSTILLFSSLLLFMIVSFHKTDGTGSYMYWLVLALIFLFLAIDETASIHEYIVVIFWRAYERSSFDNYVWPTVYGSLVVFLAIVYWKFIFSLPKKILLLFFLSAFLYVGGAIGFEILGSMYIGASWYQGIDWWAAADYKYYLISTIEESGEMFAVLVFIYALLSYIEIKWQGLYLFGGAPTLKQEER